jgi:hypothetical protein
MLRPPLLGFHVFVTVFVLLGVRPSWAIAQDPQVQQTPHQKARAQLAEAEERLRRAAELNKRCVGFLSDLEDEARLVVAECRIRVELLAIVEVRQRQIRRGDIDAKKGAQEIEAAQKLLKQLQR